MLGMPSSRQVRMMRTAISPRFAISTLGFMAVVSPAHHWLIHPSCSRWPAVGRDTLRTPDGSQPEPMVPCPGGPTTVTATELERRLGPGRSSAPVHWHEVTGSTNAVAVALAESGAPEWTLVGAGHQTDGTGPSRADVARSAGERADDLARAATRAPARPARPADPARRRRVGRGGEPWSAGSTSAASGPTICWSTRRKVGGVLAESSVAGGRGPVGRDGLGPEPRGARRRRAPAGSASVDAGSRCSAGSSSRLPRRYERRAGDLAARGRRPMDGGLGDARSRGSAAVGTDGARREGAGRGGRRAAGRLVLETADGPVVVASDEVEHLR